ncbi:GspH/FimT family pseudopilin [Massilia horti]|uniref:Type II secretion system protein H n=1 Tax=Massilia horti TaxID=2562153 RepID=A0A4Y9T1F6_9BURK|nr:GspH/FimT family pseudopilin [Massilia horti]TFW33152.1 prepilin-type N-terminal cleavage/methylation domain-containing protein [Massilia horti]
MVTPRPPRGVTLLELIAVLAILAILAGLAMPSFTGFSANMRVRSVASDLHASLSRARSEAIKRNAEVTLAPASLGRWQDGWRIPDPSGGTQVLDAHPAVPKATVSGPDRVTFLPNGRIKGTSLPSFDIFVTGASAHRCIRVDLGGRPNQSSTSC